MVRSYGNTKIQNPRKEQWHCYDKHFLMSTLDGFFRLFKLLSVMLINVTKKFMKNVIAISEAPAYTVVEILKRSWL